LSVVLEHKTMIGQTNFLIKPNLSFEVFLTKNQYELYIGAD
jgi:hypothetical protein